MGGGKRKATAAAERDTDTPLEPALENKEETSCDDLDGKEQILRVVFPGDRIPLSADSKTRIGEGVMQSQNAVFSTKCGVFRKEKSSGKVWIDVNQKLYIPAVDDLVVGTIVEKHVEQYRVDIGACNLAVLPSLNFESATKRNRPNLKVGKLVYCRVLVANKHMEPELTCISPHFKKDWVTGESLFGELLDGYMFQCSLGLARSLLAPDCFVLQCMSAYFPFEVAVGMNGHVWVKSDTVKRTIKLTNALLNSEHLNSSDIQQMCHRVQSM